MEIQIENNNFTFKQNNLINVPIELIEILCDDSTGCKKAGNNDDYHTGRQRQTFDMSVT